MPTRRRIAQGLVTGLAGIVPARVWAGSLAPTPGQIEGPFYPVHRQPDLDLDLTRVIGRDAPATGEVILVRGQVRDPDGERLSGAVVDVWQANHHGRYLHPDDPNPAPLDPNFQGRGVVATDAAGWYAIRTIRPGPYSLEHLGGSGWRCRHIHFKVKHARCAPLTTQMYFPGDPLLSQDGEIARVRPDQRPRLIAHESVDAASGVAVFRFDVVLARR